MDDEHPRFEFDNPDAYFVLIDDDSIAQIHGETYVCLNPDHDVWEPLKAQSLQSLQSIAHRCVTAKLRKIRQETAVSPVRRQVQNNG